MKASKLNDLTDLADTLEPEDTEETPVLVSSNSVLCKYYAVNTSVPEAKD